VPQQSNGRNSICRESILTSTSAVFSRPEAGLGTFPLASAFGPVAPAAVEQIVGDYLAQGGYYIDTAPTYAFGKVEEKLRKILRDHPRNSFFINTSCGYVRNGEAYDVSGRAADVREDLEGSLERLGLQFVDSYISHIPDLNTPFSETVRALEEAKLQGLARHIGVSNVTYEQLVEYRQHGAIEIVQNRFSLINRSISPDFLDFCMHEGIAIVAYQVIERGILTGKSVAELQFPPHDLRSRKPEFESTPLHILHTWVSDRLLPIAQGLGSSVEAMAIAWALVQPGIAVTQCGATKPQQVKALADARSLRLSDGTLNDIEEAYEDLEERAKAAGYASVRAVLGLEGRDPLSGLSASGR
jgi:aryl-alcohol dehydrogenase-like predicted oxidoreductase